MSGGRRVDVCVVGAGPAGSTLAIRLAELGMDVAIADRARFPRPHIGESIGPGAWPLLALLGTADEIASLASHESRNAAVLWSTDHVEHRRTPGNATVDRGRFDAILLDRARAAGVKVFEGARVHEREPAAHGWAVALPDGPLHATILADATGRRRLLGGRRTPTAPRTLAVHAVLADDGDSADTRIEAVEHGWLWGARMLDGRLRVISFVDPAAIETAGRSPARLLRQALSTTRLFCSGAIGGPDVSVHACDATSYTSGPVIDQHQVAVGEAAFAIDPLSSSGVQTAIQTAMSAAVAVATILDRAGDTAAALEFYERQVSHTVQRHAAATSAVYGDHQRFAANAFWRSRRDEAPPAEAKPDLAALLGTRVRLHEQATLRPVPCAIGDRVRRVPAIDRADLARPVAFLDGFALAPLLEDLLHAEPLGAALERWRPAIPKETALRIAAWLCAQRIIVAAEPEPSTARLSAPIPLRTRSE
ncbi:MAG: NAD(P)/FAD-dependent oxidoreductase [Chloroflexi bacterium]|nr:NAD(P)/FAD-dependent oxidoreductase [Chloroflexota bacterium]